MYVSDYKVDGLAGEWMGGCDLFIEGAMYVVLYGSLNELYGWMSLYVGNLRSSNLVPSSYSLFRSSFSE